MVVVRGASGSEASEIRRLPPLFHSSPLPTTACQGWSRGRGPQYCVTYLVLYACAPRSEPYEYDTKPTLRTRYGGHSQCYPFPPPRWYGVARGRRDQVGNMSPKAARGAGRGGRVGRIPPSPGEGGNGLLFSAHATERKPTQFDIHDCRSSSRSDKVPIKGWLDDGVPFPIRNGGSCDRGVPAVPALAESGRPVTRRGQHSSK